MIDDSPTLSLCTVLARQLGEREREIAELKSEVADLKRELASTSQTKKPKLCALVGGSKGV